MLSAMVLFAALLGASARLAEACQAGVDGNLIGVGSGKHGELAFGPAEQLEIPLDGTVLGARLSAIAEGKDEKPDALRLQLTGVTVFDKSVMGVRVFLDRSDGFSSIDLPGYVESLAFFPAPSGTPTGEVMGSFTIDLIDAVAALSDTGRLPRRGHKLTLIPIDSSGIPSGRIGLRSLDIL